MAVVDCEMGGLKAVKDERLRDTKTVGRNLDEKTNSSRMGRKGWQLLCAVDVCRRVEDNMSLLSGDKA